MGAFDDLVPVKQAGSGTFDDLIPSTDTLQGVTVTQSEGDGFLAKINAALRKPSPEWLQAPEGAVRELIQEQMPHDLPSYLASIFPPAGLAKQSAEVGAGLARGDVSGVPLVGRIPEIAAADETPAFSKERYKTALKTLMDVGMLAGAGERAPIPLRSEPIAPPELPPSPSLGPGTIAGDVSRALERRFELQPTPPEPPPQLAPAPPIEQTLPKIGQPSPFNPELGPQPYPEFQMPVRTETANLKAERVLNRRRELLARRAATQDPVELAAIDAEINDPVRNPVVHAPPPETPVQPPIATEPAVPPEPYTQEAAAARAAQPQASSEPVGGNVAGFEKVYGPGEVPAGETISPEDAWDAASARAQSGKAQPYGFVDRARTGAITPEEMGDLIHEHHRLVERAAGMEGTAEYNGAYQAAKDFADNVLKPAQTAWHQKGMTMQIARPIDLSNMTGMDQLMRQELNRGIKPSEAPKFKQMAQDVKNGQDEVAKAVGRADAKVQRSYAKVAEIPIEEAVARVKQMLKDCM